MLHNVVTFLLALSFFACLAERTLLRPQRHELKKHGSNSR